MEASSFDEASFYLKRRGSSMLKMKYDLKGMFMEKIKNKLKECPEILSFLAFVLGAAAMVFLTNNLFMIFAPFIVAYLIVKLLHPIMVKLKAKTKLPNIINTIICLFLFIGLIGGLLWLAGNYIVKGVTFVIELFSSKTTIDEIVWFINDLGMKFEKFTDFMRIDISVSDISSVVTDIAKNAVQVLSNLSISMASGIPSLLMAILIGCVAAFYMLYDYDKIASAINRQLSPKTRRILDVFNVQVLTSFMKMIVSYVFISIVCFFELIVGFWILGIKDALFVALIVAILDVLPILGSGAILIPWGIILILMGEPLKGFGLVVLWAVIIIVRQIIEPRIVGSQIGLYPLITVMALYLGLKFMGGLGLVMGPLYVLLCKRLNEEGIIRLYKMKKKKENTSENTDVEIITKEEIGGKEHAV